VTASSNSRARYRTTENILAGMGNQGPEVVEVQGPDHGTAQLPLLDVLGLVAHHRCVVKGHPLVTLSDHTHTMNILKDGFDLFDQYNPVLDEFTTLSEASET